MTTPAPPGNLLATLVRADVDFVVIGGVAAILHGATHSTHDLDIAAPIDDENVRRLWKVVGDLHPRWATVPKHPPVQETIETLATFRNIDLLTDLGRLAVLGEVPTLPIYKALRAGAVSMSIRELRAPVISLSDLIRIKESLGRPQDRIVAEQLRAIRDRPSSSDSEERPT